MAINQVALREEPVVDTKDKKLKPIIHLVPNQHLVASYLAVKTINFFGLLLTVISWKGTQKLRMALGAMPYCLKKF